MNNFPLRYKFSSILIIILITASILLHKLWFELAAKHTGIFDIKNIELTGLVSTDRQNINNIIKNASTQSLINIDINSLKTELEKCPLIKQAVISKVFPHILSIEIKERLPIVYINSGSKFYVSDNEGVILPIRDKQDLIVMNTEFGIAMNGSQIADDLLIFVLNSIKQDYLSRIKSIHINKEREISFKIPNLSSEFFIYNKAISKELIDQAYSIARSIKDNNIIPPRRIEITDKKTAVGIR
ncbi:MAG: cell division protein FtsQ/DivIB [Brevinemataceae bacterium]